MCLVKFGPIKIYGYCQKFSYKCANGQSGVHSDLESRTPQMINFPPRPDTELRRVSPSQTHRQRFICVSSSMKNIWVGGFPAEPPQSSSHLH